MSRRVAIATDIHANLPALEAALGRIDELGVDDVYCGGDLVGYGPRTCALLAPRCAGLLRAAPGGSGNDLAFF